ncbi:hypothetical protein, partial [Phaeodactylibacter luteus]|uniref:hypothetical protein n=1 Tax=Phaeodactylibacter luteus TaxID=1564516 RepID=UPI0014781D8A
VETILAVDTDGNTVTGSETIDMEAGDILVFTLRDSDNFNPSTASGSISNFSFVVPEQIIGDDDIYGGFENCWGYVTGEDKADPVITCPADNPADFLISSFDAIYAGDEGSVAQETAEIVSTYAFAGAPSAVDNCDTDLDITATDSFTEVA